MRHHDKNSKFGRETGERKALMRSLAENLISHGRIKTTEAKAKALRPFVEKLVTSTRGGSLSGRRLAVSRLGTVKRADKLAEVAPKYKDRTGGYTRIIKLPAREGDGSKMAIIELI